MDPINKTPATVGQPYEQTLGTIATDPNAGSVLTHSKVSEPNWLTIYPNGRISGVPAFPIQVAGSASLPIGKTAPAADLGAEAIAGKTYLMLQARVRKNRLGTVLVPQGAATIDGLSDPSSSSNITQAAAPMADGEFEIFSYFHKVPIEKSADGKGFIRLKVLAE